MESINHYINTYTPAERELANELAERLNDHGALAQWLKYARNVPHTFLRGTLNRVCAMPDYKITTTKVRLFVSIIENHLRYGNGHPRD